MCWCRPLVRTPCCGSDACHAAANISAAECPWCQRKKNADDFARRAIGLPVDGTPKRYG